MTNGLDFSKLIKKAIKTQKILEYPNPTLDNKNISCSKSFSFRNTHLDSHFVHSLFELFEIFELELIINFISQCYCLLSVLVSFLRFA